MRGQTTEGYFGYFQSNHMWSGICHTLHILDWHMRLWQYMKEVIFLKTTLIRERRTFGEFRRVVAVISLIPPVLSYTGGFHSARTKVFPNYMQLDDY